MYSEMEPDGELQMFDVRTVNIRLLDDVEISKNGIAIQHWVDADNAVAIADLIFIHPCRRST